MTRHVQQTPLDFARPLDRTVEAVLRLSPIGAVAFDRALQAHFVNEAAALLTGVRPDHVDLREELSRSRVVRPDLLVRHLEQAIDGPSGASFHVVESTDGAIRCLEFRPEAVDDELYVCWIRDVTEAHQLTQYRLFAEIGQLRNEKSSTQELARRLVDAVLEVLNVDIAVLTLIDRGRLVPVAARGVMLEPGEFLDPTVHRYVQEAIQSGKPTLGDGSEWQPGEPAELTGVHYIVPLTSQGEVLGTLHLGSLDSVQLLQPTDVAHTTPRFTFDTIDAVFLEALSAYAGAAVANVRLFEHSVEERAKLKTVVESIPDGIVVFDSRGEIQIANTASQRIAEREWVNLNTDSRAYRVRDVDGIAISRSEWPFFRAVRTGRAVLNEVVVFDFGDRERFVEISVVPVPVLDSTVVSFVGTLRDVTSRVRQQRQREELLSVASHELRSPLTPLTGFLQLIRKQIDRGEPVDGGLVTRAEHQVLRLARLLEILLDVTRVDSGRLDFHLHTIDIRELIAHAMESFQGHPRGHACFDLFIPGHPVMVEVDPDRIEQVLANVIDNATKHTDDADRIAISLRVDGDRATIEVRDEGAGIPPEVLPHVFERFYSRRERSRGPGMGLGLYITRQIVEGHGGDIAISSIVGESTTVTISLPVAPH